MSDATRGQIPIRPMRPSPRTPARPMDFTGLEFLRGLGITFLAFNVLLPITILVVETISQLVNGLPLFSGAQMLFLVPFYAAPISALASLTYAGALAFGLGKLLRSERRRRSHRLAFIGLGLVVGYVTSLLVQVFTYGSPTSDLAGVVLNSTHLFYALPTALAVWIGWEVTSARALRADAAAAQTEARTEATANGTV
ncbi:hypothetical protein [Leucobacter sp. 7(1)]|uniref:hypothetical protein n=1 Tax=Leucobacter sp. 7(1) TaxID=1255613 RepID=UPI000B35F5B4|nr:hypothetical protein [Leucobacter sp. 7(1)]